MTIKNILCTLSIFLLATSKLFAQDDNDIKAYIEQYKDLAIAEQIRMGIPAAVTLAQGIHESTAGLSELATKGNNHFGIKCKTTWMGETMLHDDDRKQECFRKYPTAEQSYLDHSEFLKSSNRYHFLFDLEKTDYTGWASGLKRAGYATNPSYVQKLTQLVEKFNLQQYTYEALSKAPVSVGEIIPEKDSPQRLTYVDDPSTYYKGLKGFWAKKGESLLPYATEKNIRLVKLLSLNDLADEPLQTDMFIFTERKRKVGTEEFHVVKENENMLLIAQKEAILLSNLYQYNNLIPGQEPQAGERLCLQYRAYETPKIKQQFLKELQTSQATPEPIVARTEEKKVVAQPVVKKVEPKPQPVVIEEKNIIPPPVTQEVVKQEVVAKEVKTEPIKQEPPVQEVVIKKEVEKAEPVVNEPKQEITKPSISDEEIAKGDVIIDENKAKKMEQMLNSEPLEKKVEQHPKVATTVPKQERSPFETVAVSPEPAKTEPAPVVIPAPQIPKRKYDEPDVNDSVKDLKKKFDMIVYSPQPVRKVEPPKKVEPKPEAPKPEAAKPQTQKPVAQKPLTKKEMAAKKAADAKKKLEEAKSKKNKDKKGNPKKETLTKKELAEKKKADAKKAKGGDKNTAAGKKKANAAKKPEAKPKKKR